MTASCHLFDICPYFHNLASLAVPSDTFLLFNCPPYVPSRCSAFNWVTICSFSPSHNPSYCCLSLLVFNYVLVVMTSHYCNAVRLYSSPPLCTYHPTSELLFWHLLSFSFLKVYVFSSLNSPNSVFFDQNFALFASHMVNVLESKATGLLFGSSRCFVPHPKAFFSFKQLIGSLRHLTSSGVISTLRVVSCKSLSHPAIMWVVRVTWVKVWMGDKPSGGGGSQNCAVGGW